MKRILLIPALLLALAVSACTNGPNLGALLNIATSTVTNPVNAVDIYRVKNVYAASLELAKQYRTSCWSKPYAAILADPVLGTVCKNRRATVRAMQAAQLKAASAIDSAQTFVADNPTLNAASVIAAAWSAVTAFQSAVPATR